MSISNQTIKFLQLFPNYVFRWNFGQRLPKKVNPGNEKKQLRPKLVKGLINLYFFI